MSDLEGEPLGRDALTEPYIRFFEYLTQTYRLFALTTYLVTRAHEQGVLAQVITERSGTVTGPFADPAAIVALTEAELREDFPLLRAHALVGLWGALEAFAEDMALAVLRVFPASLEEPGLRAVKVTLAEFVALDDDERLELLVREARPGGGRGVGKFDKILTLVGLHVGVTVDDRNVIYELEQVRHVWAHRGGIADRGFLKNCGCMSAGQFKDNVVAVGDRVTISDETFELYVATAERYAKNVRDAALEKYDERASEQQGA